MLSGQVQIDGRVPDIGVAEQFLNSGEIGAGFQQVRGVAVAQSMRMNAFGDAGALAATLQACQTILSEAGASTRWPFTTPGNT